MFLLKNVFFLREQPVIVNALIRTNNKGLKSAFNTSWFGVINNYKVVHIVCKWVKISIFFDYAVIYLEF